MGRHEAWEKAKAGFDEDGFLVMPDFLSAEELGELKHQVARYVSEVVPRLPGDQVYYEDKSRPETLKQLPHMHRHDPYFERLLVGSQFEEWAEFLLDGPVIGKSLIYFNKPVGAGPPTPPHQDGYYWKLQVCEGLTMWLALDAVDEENGCLRYVRGSHRRGMRPHARTQTLGISQSITDYGNSVDQAQEVVCEARPGDVLVHHGLTIHRADGNRSMDRPRKAMGFMYHSQRAKLDVCALANYQKELDTDLASRGRI